MTDSVAFWLSGFCTGSAMSGWLFSRTRRDRDPDWRRSFNHENTNPPTNEPPLKLRRSGDGSSSGSTTPKPDIIPKPQFPPPRIIREDFLP